MAPKQIESYPILQKFYFSIRVYLSIQSVNTGSENLYQRHLLDGEASTKTTVWAMTPRRDTPLDLAKLDLALCEDDKPEACGQVPAVKRGTLVLFVGEVLLWDVVGAAFFHLSHTSARCVGESLVPAIPLI